MGNNSTSQVVEKPSNHETPSSIRHRATFAYLCGKKAELVLVPQTTARAPLPENNKVKLDALRRQLSAQRCDFDEKFVNHITRHLTCCDSITEDQYVQIGQELTSLTAESAAFIEYYTKCLIGFKEEYSRTEVADVLGTTFCLACHLSNINPPEHTAKDYIERFHPVLESIFAKNESISKTSFTSWCQRHCPLLYTAVHQWCLERWQCPGPYKRHKQGFCPLLDSVTAGQSLLNMETLWLLSTTLPATYTCPQQGLRGITASLTHWLLLYDSNEHGLSRNRFDHHVMAYKGPTVSLLMFDDHIYLLATEEEWRESAQRWGGPNCIMVELSPKYRVIQGGASMFFMNFTSRTVPKGFQFGKDTKSVMLEIDEELHKVKHYGVEAKLERFETWGCGDSQTRDAQLAHKQWEQKDVEKHKNRKLKLEDWKDSPDRLLLELGGVNVSHSEEHPNN